MSIIEAVAGAGDANGRARHAGDEHHIVLRGRWRLTQGDHVVEAGPGDYVRWDGTIPHDAEVIGDARAGAILIVRLRPAVTDQPARPEPEPQPSTPVAATAAQALSCRPTPSVPAEPVRGPRLRDP